MHERFKGFGVKAVSFEDLLHEFSAIIETTDNPVTVQAGVLRQARRLVPGYRIELVTGPAPPHEIFLATKRMVGNLQSQQSFGITGDGQNGQLVLEVPLRCGSLVRGRLRIRSRGTGAPQH